MTESIGDNAAEQLRSIIERIEAVNIEIKDRQEDRKGIYVEAESAGYDPKALKAIVRMRAEDPDKRAEHQAHVETYKTALGMD